MAASKEPAELNRVAATSLAFLLGVAAVGTLVTVPVALAGDSIFESSEDLSLPLLVGCVGSCALLPLGVFTNVLYGLDRIVARNMVLLIRPIAAFVAVVVVVESGGGLFAIVCASVGAELAVVAAQVVYTLATVPGLDRARGTSAAP